MTALIEVGIKQVIYSSVDGRTGNWELRTRATLGAIPHEGSSVVFTYGESELCETVRRVYFYTGGAVTVELRSIVTDSPDVLAELDHRVKAWRWKQAGGPWSERPARLLNGG